MATIKLQPSGKVVIKDGKVACSCCAQPSGCCPYPAQGFVDGLYTVDDLPDEIIFTKASIDLIDVLLTKTGGSISFYEGYYGANLLSVKILGSVWILFAFGEEFGLSSRPECLFVTNDEFDGSFDTFADSYTVSGGPLGAITVTRVSLCLWTGLDSCGNTASLELLEDSFNGKLWFVSVPNYILPCVVFDVLQGENIGFGNTPVGSYGNFPYEEGFLFVS